MSAAITVLNGPNLNRLGKRQPEIYGSTTLVDIEAELQRRANDLGVELNFFQTNNESQMLDAVHAAADRGDGVIINPGAWTHTSVALRDALAEVADGAGFIEVHISNVHAREAFRHHSYLSDIAIGVIAGLGINGYYYALSELAERLSS